MPEEIHESAQRLYAAAHKLLALKGKSAIARLLNEYPQTLNNWEGPRGVSEGGALKAQARIGCDANWLRTGEGSMLAGWPFSAEVRGAVMQLSQEQRARIDATLRAMLNIQPQTTPSPTAAPPATVTRHGRASGLVDQEKIAEPKKRGRSSGRSA